MKTTHTLSALTSRFSLLLFLVISLFGVNSCKKEEPTPKSPNQLVGEFSEKLANVTLANYTPVKSRADVPDLTQELADAIIKATYLKTNFPDGELWENPVVVGKPYYGIGYLKGKKDFYVTTSTYTKADGTVTQINEYKFQIK